MNISATLRSGHQPLITPVAGLPTIAAPRSLVLILLLLSTSIFATYTIVELLTDDPGLRFALLRLVCIVILLAATWLIYRAIGSKRTHLLSIAGLVFGITASSGTTLSAYFAGESFEIAVAYGFLITTLYPMFWVMRRYVVLGTIGALGPPTLLMIAQQPSAQTIINYSFFAATVLIVVGVVTALQRRVRSDLSSLHVALIARAEYDDLTGLLKRQSWLDAVRAMQYQQSNQSFTLLYLDLNGFKSINDTYGHDIGDLALQYFAETLRRTMHPGDLIARLGGDEFAVAVIGPLIQAEARAQRIHIALRKPPVNVPPMSVSIGMTEYQQGEPIDTLLRRADHAMLREKDNRRGHSAIGPVPAEPHPHHERRGHYGHAAHMSAG